MLFAIHLHNRIWSPQQDFGSLKIDLCTDDEYLVLDRFTAPQSRLLADTICDFNSTTLAAPLMDQSTVQHKGLLRLHAMSLLFGGSKTQFWLQQMAQRLILKSRLAARHQPSVFFTSCSFPRHIPPSLEEYSAFATKPLTASLER